MSERCRDSPSRLHTFGKWHYRSGGMSHSMCKWCSKPKHQMNPSD